MTTVEVKRILQHQIAAIDDKSFLDALKSIVDRKTEGIVYQTTAQQKLSICEGQTQIAKKETYTSEQVQKEINQWLNEK